MRKPERCVDVWRSLVSAAKRREILNYSDIAREIGGIPQGVGALLVPIQRYCDKKGFPPLTALVVQANTGEPGAAYEGSGDWKADVEAVYEFAWQGIPPRANVFADPE